MMTLPATLFLNKELQKKKSGYRHQISELDTGGRSVAADGLEHCNIFAEILDPE